MIIRRALGAAVGTALVLAAATACGGGGSATGGSTTGTSGTSGTLAIGLQQPIPSMNPVISPIGPTLEYAYDPLIYWANDASYAPDLATSWGYVGTGNTSFHLTLRPGVKFSDGTALTAQAVVNSMDYFLKTPNPNLLAAGPIKSVRAVNASTVQISYSRPFPNAVDSLTQFWGIGMIIGPKGLADPKSLETTSDGVGQYTLDSAASRANSVYTFNASKTYFNQSAIKYKTIQLRVIPSAGSRVSSLQSGQIQDATQISLGQVGTSAASGFQRLEGNTTWMLMEFLPATSGPLSSTTVRQAFEYAVDRPAIVQNFYAGLAVAQDQFSPQGTVGYTASLDNRYSYNPAKAKQLLSQAGYGSGFTFKLLTNQIADPGGLLGQVIATELEKVGIKVQLTSISGSFAQFQSALSSGKYDGVLWNLSSIDLYSTATQTIVSPHTLLNPTTTADARAVGLLNAAAAASGAANVAAELQKLNAYLTQAAVGVPIVTRTNVDLVSSSVKLPAQTYVTPQPSMIGPAASYAVSG